MFLVFSLLCLSGSLYAKKRGAKLIVTKKDGQQIQGELITVKPNSLLLLTTWGKDVSIDIEDIKIIRIVKKLKVLQGMGLGLLIGGGIGAFFGFLGGDQPDAWYKTAEEKALVGGIAFGALGSLIGGIVGLFPGKDKIILFEGRTSSWIEWDLKELRKKARIPDYK